MWPSMPGVGLDFLINLMIAGFIPLSNRHVVINQPGSAVLLADKACVFS